MVRTPVLWLILFGLLCPLVGVMQGQVKVYATVDVDSEIYPGDSFVLAIVVQGGRAERVDTSPLSNFRISGPSTSSSTRIENFETTQSNTVSYSIQVEKPGPLRIPSLNVTVEGRIYKTNPVELSVAQPGTTDKMELQATLSEQTCYVGQPVLLTVEWTFKTQASEAMFSVPIFESDDFTFSDPTLPANTTPGETYSFQEVTVQLFQERQMVKGVEVSILRFYKILVPKRSGKLSFAPVTASAKIVVGRVRTGDFFRPVVNKTQRFSVYSKTLQLEVLPLPSSPPPPPGFDGLVGNYDIQASATPTEVSVGDPITLTIQIGGNPHLDPVQWPALDQIEELADNFRIPLEKASPVIDGNYKVFTQTLRANNDHITAIPPIPLVLFDPKTGTYQIRTSEPIPLTVATSKMLSNADVGGLNRRPVNREVEAIQEGLAANYEGDNTLVHQGFSIRSALVQPGALTLWLLPLLTLIVTSVWHLHSQDNPERRASRTRRQAGAQAQQALQKLNDLPASDQPIELARILCQYTGDRFDKTAGSLTAHECHDTVVQATGRTEAAKTLQDLVAAGEAARYAVGLNQEMGDRIQTASELIRQIEEGAKQK